MKRLFTQWNILIVISLKVKKKNPSHYNCFFIVLPIYVHIVTESLNHECGVEFNALCVNPNLLQWVGSEKAVSHFCLVDSSRYMFNAYTHIDALM